MLAPDYHRTWSEYRDGFGTIDTNYWLGNEPSTFLTTKFSYGIRIDTWDEYGQYDYAEYHSFKLDDEESGYELLLDEFSAGSNGDGLLAYHSGNQFYTYDDDTHISCANFTGGWWYSNVTNEACFTSKLVPDTDVVNDTMYTGFANWKRNPAIYGTKDRILEKVMMRMMPMLHKSRRKNKVCIDYVLIAMFGNRTSKS